MQIATAFAATIAAATLIASATESARADTYGSGTFTGRSDHITTGGVTLVETAGGGHVVILDADFSLDGAPDPRVKLGRDGAPVDAADLGELTSIDGLQAYVVPASVDVSDLDEVWIWCEQFAVPLGVADLN